MWGQRIVTIGLTSYLSLAGACTSQPSKVELAQRFSNNYDKLEELHLRNEITYDQLLRQYDQVRVQQFSENDPEKRAELDSRIKSLEAELGFNIVVRLIIEDEIGNAELCKSLTDLVKQ